MNFFYEPRKIYTEEGKKNFEPIFNSGYSGMPQSLFFISRLVLILALVLCVPFLFIAFVETLQAFIILLAIFFVIDAICRKFGWHRLNDDDVNYWD
ncbi:Uncharacterised protein [Bacillus freudenreichii]|nr:Uncharacterised protein [Bacillus freudenreichii]